MTILLLQIFLLLLAAFLLGATAACLARRGLADEAPAAAVPPLPPGGRAPIPGGDGSQQSGRFERALSGDAAGLGAMPAFAKGAPMIEVQPVAARTGATQAAASPLPVPPKREAIPQSVASTPAPAPPPKPSAQPSKPAAPQPSYVAIAVAQAAAAAAVASAPPPISAASSGPADDLTRIRSIDRATAGRLAELGIRRFDDIAAWSAGDVARISQALGVSSRIEAEGWIDQARVLAKGTPGTGARPSSQAASAAPSSRFERLNRIIGIDAKTEGVLNANGVARVSDVAAWGEGDIQRFERLLGAPGRVKAERWIEQAHILTRPLNGSASAGSASAPQTPAPKAPALQARAQPPVAPVPAATAATTGPRSELPAMRSVRSEALRGDIKDAIFPPFGAVDDLKRIRGIGILIEKKLNALGVTTYEQVANWTRADIDRVSQVLDFKGRIERENWIEQARILSSGGQTDFSRRTDRSDGHAFRDLRG